MCQLRWDDGQTVIRIGPAKMTQGGGVTGDPQPQPTVAVRVAGAAGSSHQKSGSSRARSSLYVYRVNAELLDRPDLYLERGICPDLECLVGLRGGRIVPSLRVHVTELSRYHGVERER